MRNNQKLLHGSIILIVFCTCLCIGFTIFTNLRSPVFLRYCLEIPVYNQGENYMDQQLFQLQYITNANDTRQVTWILFPELPDYYFNASEDNPGGGFIFYHNQQRILGAVYGTYSVRTVYVSIAYPPEKGLLDREYELHTAQLLFSDGSQLKADIGLIVLYSENGEENNDIITMQSSSSSNDGSCSSNYIVKDNIKLLTLKSEALDKATKDLKELTLSGIDYREILNTPYQKNSYIMINARFNNLQENATSVYDVYDIKPKLSYEKENGAVGSMRVVNIHQQRWLFSYKEILKYLHSRGRFR